MSDGPAHWSWSQLDRIAKCGVQYAFIYHEGLRMAPGAALIRGGSVHVAREVAMRHKIGYPEEEPLSEDELTEVTRDHVHAEFDGDLQLTAEEEAQGVDAVRGATTDEAVGLTLLDRRVWHPELHPVAVEERIEWQPEGFEKKLLGIVDLADAVVPDEDAPSLDRTVLRDMKTGKRLAKGAEHTDLQLTMEAMLWQSKYGVTPRVGFDNLVANKTPVADRRESVRTAADFAPLLNRIARAEETVQAGRLMPAPSGAWWCSEKFCGFWNICPYAARPVAVAVSGGNA